MQVQLISYTGKGSADPAREAANLLVFTKSTRLQMTPSLMEDIESWPWPKIENELAYMARTIPSSWEFVDYVFLITGVTRAFTHQLVRTRTSSYAQQTMRVLDVRGFDWVAGPTIAEDERLAARYRDIMNGLNAEYQNLIDQGAAVEDARGILPTNICTNIVMKANLRNLAELLTKRSSPRTQGEYRQFLLGMKAEMIRVHPWCEMFLNRDFNAAATELDEAIAANISDPAERTRMIKLVDELRKG